MRYVQGMDLIGASLSCHPWSSPNHFMVHGAPAHITLYPLDAISRGTEYVLVLGSIKR